MKTNRLAPLILLPSALPSVQLRSYRSRIRFRAPVPALLLGLALATACGADRDSVSPTGNAPEGSGPAATDGAGSSTSEASENSAAPAVDDEELTSGPLCATCVAGGETTDFNGSRPNCMETPVPVERTDPAAIELDVERHWTNLNGSFEVPMTWTVLEEDKALGGFEPSTTLALTFEVVGIERIVQEPYPNDTRCVPSDSLSFTVAVDLEAQDGSISGSYETTVRGGRGTRFLRGDRLFDYPLAGPLVPLSSFEGTLQLGIDTTREHRGGLEVYLLFDDRGPRGRLTPTILYSEGTPTTSRPIEAVFPGDECGIRAVKLEDDAELFDYRDGTPIGSAADLYERVKSTFAPSVVIPGTWLDGSVSDLTLSVGDTFTSVCESDRSYEFHAPVRLRASDPQMDLTLSTRMDVLMDEGSPDWVSWSGGTDFSTLTELEERSGLSGVTGEESERIFLGLDGWHDVGNPDELGGSLELYSDPVGECRVNREFVSWCRGERCEEAQLEPSKWSCPEADLAAAAAEDAAEGVGGAGNTPESTASAGMRGAE